MAVRKIVIVPNEVLTLRAKNITHIDENVKKLAVDLLDTLNHAKEPEGAGIAANQVGVAERICIVRRFLSNGDVPNSSQAKEDLILINPKIISKSTATNIEWEGCLSVPNIYGQVQRYSKIKVRAKTLEGDDIQINATGFLARVMQHEIDHLDGVLFTSRVIGKKITEAELDIIISGEN